MHMLLMYRSRYAYTYRRENVIMREWQIMALKTPFSQKLNQEVGQYYELSFQAHILIVTQPLRVPFKFQIEKSCRYCLSPEDPAELWHCYFVLKQARWKPRYNMVSVLEVSNMSKNVHMMCFGLVFSACDWKKKKISFRYCGGISPQIH